MVLYICNKCNKNFTRKQCYQAHINRKYSCTYEDITNKKQDNTNTSNKTIELEQKNKELEQKIKLLEEKNIILHTQNSDKDKYLEKKDLEIKNLYKNIYSKNSDIQIKKIQEYVYIIRECDFVRLNENIYKIGRTSKANPEDRFQKYRSKANYENEVFIISRNRNSRFFWC
jgi:hypothetical protein